MPSSSPPGRTAGRLAACLLWASAAWAQGISWPEGQVLPRFADYSALDIADLGGQPFDRKLSLTVLQGLVNRVRPRVYLLDAQQSGEGKTFWLDKIPAVKTSIADPLSLFAKYKSDASGLCIYDPAVPATLNVAVTAAGVTGCVAVSPAVAQILSAAPYGYAISLDLRPRAFADSRAAYAWAWAEYGARANRRILAGMKPGVHYPLYDHIVANRAMCVWLAPEAPAERPLLDSLFSRMPANGVYVGWWAGETSGVGYASGYGVMTFATDWFSNATVHSGGSAALSSLPGLAAPPKLENKAYIALILSDGDNLQEQQHLFPVRWRSALRGTFPVSWTQSPALLDFAPAMLDYYYATRTPGDCFITGPSGVGYVLPEDMDGGRLREYARLTEAYLKRTGIRGATIWGNSAAASDTFGIHCPSLLGIANHTHHEPAPPRGFRHWARGLPSVDMTPDYASFGSQAIGEIDAKLAAWKRDRPLFIASQLNANVAGLDQLKLVYDAYRENPDVVFVRADQLFQLMRLANPDPVGLAPGPAPLRGRGWISLGGGAFLSPQGLPTDLRGRHLLAELPSHRSH